MGWNDVGNTNGGNGQSAENKYMKLEDVKTIRIVTDEPYSRWVHWIPQANGGKGMSVDCPGKGCPICSIIKADKETKQKPRYASKKSHAVWVIDRNDNEFKILDKGNSLFEQLSGLYQEFKHLNFDIKIRTNGTGFQNVTYTVIPMQASALTPAEIEAIKQLKDFNTVYTKFTPEQIALLMNGASPKDFNTNDSSNNDELPDVDFTKNT